MFIYLDYVPTYITNSQTLTITYYTSRIQGMEIKFLRCVKRYTQKDRKRMSRLEKILNVFNYQKYKLNERKLKKLS